MIEEKMRTFEFEGKRRGVRLDEGTWQAVDWLAAQRGKKWADLVTEWVTLIRRMYPESSDNMTGIIRSAAMQCLLSETIFAERATGFASTSPVWQCLGVFSDEDFKRTIELATDTEGSDDFGSFKISAGTSEFGNVTFYIENGMKEFSNLIISTPFTREEWERKVEGA